MSDATSQATSPVGRKRGLPPGQRLVAGFPRFGEHLWKPPPPVPTDPVLEIRGTTTAPFQIPLAELADLGRHEVVAPFHCVAGWSTVELCWEGVSFKTFYDQVIAPRLDPDTTITHIAFRGLDHFRSVLTIEDAFDPDVLLAERLDGEPLGPDHGAPLRLMSPAQYGYMSTKHLCRIDLLTAPPAHAHRSLGERILESHPRARVWNEERHGSVPGRLVRPFYRSLKPILLALCAHGDSTPESPMSDSFDAAAKVPHTTEPVLEA